VDPIPTATPVTGSRNRETTSAPKATNLALSEAVRPALGYNSLLCFSLAGLFLTGSTSLTTFYPFTSFTSFAFSGVYHS
jgi:hypothetical protein